MKPAKTPYTRASLANPPNRSPGESFEVEGLLDCYLLNPRGEVDGFLLADGTQIKFPPHLGRELALVAKPGDPLRANGHWEAEGQLKGYVVQNPESGAALREIKPTSPDRAGTLPSLMPMQAQGRIRQLKRNGHGDVDAAILDDGSFVHFPPHVGKKQLEGHVEVGMTIAATGFGVETAFGRSLSAALIGKDVNSLRAIEPPKPKKARLEQSPSHHEPHHEPHHGPRHGAHRRAHGSHGGPHRHEPEEEIGD